MQIEEEENVQVEKPATGVKLSGIEAECIKQNFNFYEQGRKG